ncbi:prolyl oligopeptidase family protein [Marinicella sp. W31]|uniref:prolyl oligopeptidase family serine peptidase n=1 Tax=Marinicella sp. W31 TaxID=3023713 RepID=UPI003757ADC4
MHKPFFLLLLVSALVQADDDAFLWLEEVDGEKAMQWVVEQNENTAQAYKSSPLYKELYTQALNALDNKSRLPSVSKRGKFLYNYWKDSENPRGLYRRTSLKELKKDQPKWETVLDMDQYNRDHEGNWVFKGMNCLPPKYRQCLVYLSPGGGDSVVLKEFDAKKKRFIENGFSLPNSKMQASWQDSDHLFVSTDFGPNSMTDSGYPRIVKLWKRGTPLEQAQTLFTADKKSVSAFAYRSRGKKDLDFLIDSTSFWENTYFQLIDNKPVELKLPATAVTNGVFNGQLIITLQEDWSFQNKQLKQGYVLLMDPALLRGGKGDWEVLIMPARNVNIESIASTDSSIIVNQLEDVIGKVLVYQRDKNGNWNIKEVPFPDNGTIDISNVDDETGDFFAQYQSFTTPPTLYHVDGKKLEPESIKSQAPSFDGSKYQVKQYFATSKDGTKVPYFVVMGNNTEMNGRNPTHIFSYGGFRNSLKPSYSGSYESLEGAYGKMWLDRGGVFVSANIRGGGAYGPAWHEAALLKNRHKSYEDFEAVAEDLIAKKITASNYLSIEGRSNGGLLVGAAMTRRPDLYSAVICGVPLLDMKRYNKLLAGASWMGEYGNPDEPEMWEYIKTYSPYQNLKKDTDYPATFFYTSTRDDRVHPGHARKMAAKMRSYGYPIWYYENTEGGHGGSSTNAQLATRLALAFTHLWNHAGKD